MLEQLELPASLDHKDPEDPWEQPENRVKPDKLDSSGHRVSQAFKASEVLRELLVLRDLLELLGTTVHEDSRDLEEHQV